MKLPRKFRGKGFKTSELVGLEEETAAMDELWEWCQRNERCWRLEVAAALRRHLEIVKGKP